MKIQEVIESPNREESLENCMFTPIHTKPAWFDNLWFGDELSKDEHKLGLFDANYKLIAFLLLNIREHGFWQITLSLTGQNYRNHGCFRYLLIQAVVKHDIILGDEVQTSLARKAWESLIRFSGGQFSIFVYNVETKEKILAKKLSSDEIWNDDPNTILMIEKGTALNESIIFDQNREKLFKRVCSTRTEMHLWFGKNSSTEEYNNP
ncbi:Uncharacterised protein [uncultured archaeon]|nr:Uncharacterised protein [uncultured archaeon]